MLYQKKMSELLVEAIATALWDIDKNTGIMAQEVILGEDLWCSILPDYDTRLGAIEEMLYVAKAFGWEQTETRLHSKTNEVLEIIISRKSL